MFLNKLRKKFKRLYITMFKNYIVFMFLMLLILLGSIGFVIFTIGKMVSSEEYVKDTQKFFMASKIVKDDYKKIDASKIIESKGWVEILDSNKKIIYVIGSKKDKAVSYTEDELLHFMDLSYNNLKSDTSYFYSVASFNSHEKKFYCIVKVPPGIVKLNVDIAPSPDKYIEKAAIYILVAILVIIVFLITSVFLYAYLTTKKVVMPLKKILQGIKRMTEEDYSTRINFNAENEFAEIRDAFNFMAEKIETSKAERNRMEILKQQLLSDISHDLKTPLTSIMGYSKALRDDVVKDDERIKQYLNTIYNKSKRTVSLIENLHEFTKLDNNGFLINKENWDFCEFVRKIASEYYNEFEEKCFQIEINLPEHEIMYEFDKLEMERAISNIISNVLKYNKFETKVKIELTCDNYEIQLIIADDGIGIDEGLKKNIFEPFSRGDKSRYTKGGTGLGLSIANKIVQKHGGSLTLESCKEYKTMFKLKFEK